MVTIVEWMEEAPRVTTDGDSLLIPGAKQERSCTFSAQETDLCVNVGHVHLHVGCSRI